MDTSSFVPATGATVLAAAVSNLAAINDNLNLQLSAARTEICRLEELLKTCSCKDSSEKIENTSEKNHNEKKLKPWNYKTILCTHFEKGTCTRGDKCHFAHGVEELRKIPEN